MKRNRLGAYGELVVIPLILALLLTFVLWMRTSFPPRPIHDIGFLLGLMGGFVGTLFLLVARQRTRWQRLFWWSGIIFMPFPNCLVLLPISPHLWVAYVMGLVVTVTVGTSMFNLGWRMHEVQKDMRCSGTTTVSEVVQHGNSDRGNGMKVEGDDGK